MQSVFLCPNITTMWPKKLWIHILRSAIFKYGELFLMPRSQQHTLCMCEAPRNLWSGCSPSIRDVILGVFLVSNMYTNIYVNSRMSSERVWVKKFFFSLNWLQKDFGLIVNPSRQIMGVVTQGIITNKELTNNTGQSFSETFMWKNHLCTNVQTNC